MGEISRDKLNKVPFRVGVKPVGAIRRLNDYSTTMPSDDGPASMVIDQVSNVVKGTTKTVLVLLHNRMVEVGHCSKIGDDKFSELHRPEFKCSGVVLVLGVCWLVKHIHVCENNHTFFGNISAMATFAVGQLAVTSDVNATDVIPVQKLGSRKFHTDVVLDEMDLVVGLSGSHHWLKRN